jgi:chromosome segregation ATPase
VGETALEEIQQALSQAHDALLRQNDALHAAREALSEIRNRILNGSENIERLDAETESMHNRLRLLEATMAQSDGGMNEADTLLAQARQALEDRRQSHAEASEKAEKLENELTAHKNAMMERMNRIQNVRTSQARQSAMQQQMTARRAEISQQIERGEERGVQLTAALEEAKTNLAHEQSLLEDVRAGAEAFEQSTKQLLQDILMKQKNSKLIFLIMMRNISVIFTKITMHLRQVKIRSL